MEKINTMKEYDIKPYQVVAGRNRQRMMGELTPPRITRERALMEEILAREYRLFQEMELIKEPLEEIQINPDLTTFLDGKDGRGGYADYYAEREYREPGTKLEMDLERREIQRHLLTVLTHEYIEGLKRNDNPLVLIEGGAGPDLRTFETACSVLSERKKELQGIPIKIVITDISERMAAITAGKIRTSSNLVDVSLDIKTAVLAADVFELLAKLPEDKLSYALLPFGVLSFGLDGKNPQQILKMVHGKLTRGGRFLTTVYNSKWRSYTDKLENAVGQINSCGGNLNIDSLNPFVIRILDGKMQVGGGLAFNCRTFSIEELSQIVHSTGLKVDSCISTPQGWAYWPNELLARVVGTRVWPEGYPIIPAPSEMNLAKNYLLELVQNGGGNNQLQLVNQLACAIPNGDQILDHPAPYITLTARK